MRTQRYSGIDVGADLVKPAASAGANSPNLEELTRPLLEALAKLSGLESTYLMVFDWQRNEQRVAFLYSTGPTEISEGLTIALPDGVAEESLPGVTRSPARRARAQPDSLVARGLGLEAYVSVPVMVARHKLFGMLCGASEAPGGVSEGVVSVMESIAQIIADEVTREVVAATAERAERAEERWRSRVLFLAEAEHRLKTPLTVLEGASTALLNRWPELPRDDRTALLTMLVRNTRDLARMVDELLVEARTDAQASEPALVPLEPFVTTIVTAFDVVSASHEVVADGAQDALLWVDPASLYQVLGHLLDNAIKYSPDGGVVEVLVATTPDHIRIDVIDEGIGVPEGVDVFEAFQRGDPSELTGTPGMGLGLHIVRRLVAAMGGSVAARRNEERGSTFTLHLPLAGVVPAIPTG